MNRPLLSTTWDRLKGHSAFRVGTLYAGASWFLIEAADTLGMSPGPIRQFALLLAAGFIVVVPAVWYATHRQSRPEAAPAIVPLPPLVTKPRHMRRWAATVGSFCVIALGLWGFRTRAEGDAVPAAATHLAVLPFHATGSAEVRELGIGMVDVLAAALNDVGGIRTVPGRTVMAAVNGADPIDIEGALELGEKLRAGSVLTGSITAFGTRVRLTAELRSVQDGFVLASAEAEGAQDDVLQLADQLAVTLLRDMWRTRAPVPSVRLAGLLTSAPQALRAYLRGEEHMRAMRFDSANDFFQAAVRADSTFALAWLRLAENRGWMADFADNVPERREYTARALAHAARLPSREQSFVRAVHLAQHGRLEAFDSLASYVQRYPDDPVGWYELGDTRYHAAFLGLFAEDEIIQPFLESARLDPSYGVGLTHVLDILIQRGDSAAFAGALEQYRRAASPARVASYEHRARIRFASNDRLLSELSATARALHPVEDRVTIGGLIGAVGSATRLDIERDPRLYYIAMDSLRRIFPSERTLQRRATSNRVIFFGSLGMTDSVLVEVDRYLALPDPPPEPVPPHLVPALWHVRNSLDGTVPLATAEPAALALESQARSPEVRGTLHVYWLMRGQPQRAAQFPLEMPPPPPGIRDVDWAAVEQANRGMIKLIAGDTTDAVGEVDDALRKLGYVDAGYVRFPLYHFAEKLTHVPARRAQGIRMLRWLTQNFAIWTTQAYLALARALEADGDRAGARDAYAHVVRLWAHADEARVRERAEAEAALRRLAGEK